jgi:hypothetical protein
MTEEQRIMEILTTMQATGDADEVLRLHEQLPEKLSKSIFQYGVEPTISAIRADAELLNHVGPMRRAR